MTNRISTATNKIAVWDPFVRLFHAALALGFACAYLTSQAGMQQLHARIGYFLLGLIAARLIWGVIGSRHARFRDFVYSPRAIFRHAQAIWAGHPQRHLGHDPAGGAMILLMLFMLVSILSAGMLLLGTLEFAGPLQTVWLEDPWVYLLRDVHVTLVNIFLVLILLHISGVILACIQQRENLLWSMISGNKKQRAPN